MRQGTMPTIDGVCLWCERPFQVRRGSSPKRFCCGAHRLAFWSALRRWAERAVAAGVLTVDHIRIDHIRNGDPGAWTLLPSGNSPAPPPETWRPTSEPVYPARSTPQRGRRTPVRAARGTERGIVRGRRSDVRAAIRQVQALARRPLSEESAAASERRYVISCPVRDTRTAGLTPSSCLALPMFPNEREHGAIYQFFGWNYQARGCRRAHLCSQGPIPQSVSSKFT
jgi:hypothetical protein